ncbi:PilN domain-containing protein [Dechloromonas sp. ARDL1]|uniref:PilN domain-containing protein n=1 Tax=Dechloromonas sp. ARDL1 TaxID=3322121 RepID=UPI003DA71753
MPDLDFQPRRPGLLVFCLLLAGGLLAADVVMEERERRERLDDLSGQVAQAKRRLEKRLDAERWRRPENVFSPEETAALRQAYAAIGVEWERLFGTIDAAVSEDVALVAIRPSISGKSVQISGEARNLGAALAFVEALRREPLSQVVLVSHQLKQTDPQRPYVFEIAAAWLPAS